MIKEQNRIWTASWIGNLETKEFRTKNSWIEDEKTNRHELITWNDDKGEIFFGENKKKSRSKNYKRIGIHLIPIESSIEDENSPSLIKCQRLW